MYNSYNKYKQKYLNLKKLTGGASKSSTSVTSNSGVISSTSVGVTSAGVNSSAKTFIPKILTLQDMYNPVSIINGPECFNIDINSLNTNADYIFDLRTIDPTKITLESVKCGLTFINSKINSSNPIPYKEFTRTKLIIDGMNLSFNSDLLEIILFNNEQQNFLTDDDIIVINFRLMAIYFTKKRNKTKQDHPDIIIFIRKMIELEKMLFNKKKLINNRKKDVILNLINNHIKKLVKPSEQNPLQNNIDLIKKTVGAGYEFSEYIVSIILPKFIESLNKFIKTDIFINKNIEGTLSIDFNIPKTDNYYYFCNQRCFENGSLNRCTTYNETDDFIAIYLYNYFKDKINDVFLWTYDNYDWIHTIMKPNKIFKFRKDMDLLNEITNIYINKLEIIPFDINQAKYPEDVIYTPKKYKKQKEEREEDLVDLNTEEKTNKYLETLSSLKSIDIDKSIDLKSINDITDINININNINDINNNINININDLNAIYKSNFKYNLNTSNKNNSIITIKGIQYLYENNQILINNITKNKLIIDGINILFNIKLLKLFVILLTKTNPGLIEDINNRITQLENNTIDLYNLNKINELIQLIMPNIIDYFFYNYDVYITCQSSEKLFSELKSFNNNKIYFLQLKCINDEICTYINLDSIRGSSEIFVGIYLYYSFLTNKTNNKVLYWSYDNINYEWLDESISCILPNKLIIISSEKNIFGITKYIIKEQELYPITKFPRCYKYYKQDSKFCNQSEYNNICTYSNYAVE